MSELTKILFVIAITILVVSIICAINWALDSDERRDSRKRNGRGR